jgi:nucleoside-diphosphate-sugar epimerase
MSKSIKVLLVGGGGYVGVELQRLLAESGYEVRVLDTFWYPAGRWSKSDGNFVSSIEYVEGDIRDSEVVRKALIGIDACIHLACISNDPSYELNPNLARSINFEAFIMFIAQINNSSVKKLIYASSSSVYGVKEEENVTEDLICEPLTDYSKYKVMCEDTALNNISDKVCLVVVRPSTVCGYSRRQRFDLVVNILTLSALTSSVINVDGGDQFRPNLHIKDMNAAYKLLLETNPKIIDRKIYNIAGENLTVLEIAKKVQFQIGNSCEIIIHPVKDQRSYRVSGKRIAADTGFIPKFSVNDAVTDLANAFNLGKFLDLESEAYYNIKQMKLLMSKALIK